MKKLTTLALAAMMLAPATSFAESFERVVTNASELKTALNGHLTDFQFGAMTKSCYEYSCIMNTFAFIYLE